MKKQERFSKEFMAFCNEKKPINIDISAGELFDTVTDFDFPETVLFIKSLEQQCEDWSVTEELFQYFSELMLDYDEDLNSENPDPLEDKTKVLVKQLYNKYIKVKS